MIRTKFDYQHFRVWKSTLRNLRLLAVLTDRTMIETIDAIVTAALNKIKAKS